MTRQIAAFTLLVALAGGSIGYVLWTVRRATPVQTGDSVYFKVLRDFTLVDAPDTTDEAIPKPIRDLDGKAVSLEGYIFAGNDTSDEIGSFQFLYDVPNGSRHAPPLVHQRVFATVVGGRKIPNPGMYTLTKLHGILHVGIHHDRDGLIDSVYRMDVDGATPVP